MLTQLNGNREQQGFDKQGPSWAGEHGFFFFFFSQAAPGSVLLGIYGVVPVGHLMHYNPLRNSGTLQPGVEISLTFFFVDVCFVVEISRRLVLGSNSC